MGGSNTFREEKVPCGCCVSAKHVQREPYEPRNPIDFTAKYRLESEDGNFYANVFETEKEKIELLPD
jgi:hypothetical protein